MANAKSARPSCQARVSRISASERTSNCAADCEFRDSAVRRRAPSIASSRPTQARAPARGTRASTEVAVFRAARAAQGGLRPRRPDAPQARRCSGVEERPFKKVRDVAVAQFPSNCGFCLAANAR